MRYKNFIVFILILCIGLLSFLLTSCNIYEKTGISNEESSESCEEKVTRLLDEGEYDKVLETLNSTICNDMDPKEKSINRAAAYLGKAGFSVPSLLKDILNATNEESGNEITTFTRVLSDKASGSNLNLINKARKAYEDVGVNCTQPQGAEEENICFLEGITEVAKMGIGTSLLFKSENETEDLNKIIDYWTNATNATIDCSIDVDANTQPDSLQFSSCALEFAANYNNTTPLSGNLTNTGCAYNVVSNNASFGSNKTFWILKLTISPDSNQCGNYTNKTAYKVLENSTSGLLAVLTDGFCYASNGSYCDSVNETSGCYPCPVINEEEGESLTVVGTIVESLNNGGDLIENIVQTSEEDNETAVKDAIDDFKKDFCEENPSQCACYVNGIWQQCSNSTIDSAEDIKIGVYNSTTGEVEVTPETQVLLIDYFTN